MPRINLGDEVKDTISGFKGIVVAAHTYLHGCIRLSVCSKSTKNGKPETETFDEPQLELITSKGRVNKETTGGPDKFIDNGRK